MQALFRMVTDSSGEVLEIAAGSAVRSAPIDISPAGGARNLVEHPDAEESEQPFAPLASFLRAGLMRRHVRQVDADDIGNGDFVNVALAAGRRVFARDVLGEAFLSLWAVASAEASATLESAVSDDPDGPVDAAVALAGRSDP